MENELNSLKKTIKEQQKVISLSKELVELVLKNLDSIDSLDVAQKAELLSYNQIIIMAALP